MPRFIKGIETNFLGRMTAAQAGALTNAVPGDEVYVTDAGTGMQAFRNAAGAWIAFDTGIAIVGGAVAPILQALTTSVGNATVGTAFTATISGRTTGSTLSLTGAGAPGLSISGTTISGTPTTAGTVSIVETLAGATGSPRTSGPLVTVAATAQALAIAGSPGNATVGDNPTFTPTISGGTAPYTLSLLSGTLPPGRTVNGAAKTVTGAYTTAGSYSYVLRATDNVGATADLSVSLTVAAALARMALSEPMAIGGNSYDAQSGNINTWLYALIESEGRGLGGMGFLQARGGDRLTHLLDRIKPMKSQQSLRPFIMNVENDLADSAIADSTAGGDAIKARMDANRAELINARSGARLCAALNASTNGARSKPVAFARYKALVQADSNYDTVDESAVFDPQATSPVQSTDNIHPNTVAAAMAVGKQRGQYVKGVYVTDPMMPANGAMPTNMMSAAFNPATAWTATSTSPGLTVTQSQGTLRDNSARACHIFTVTGTATQDETLATTAPDSQFRLTIALTATDTYAKVIASLMRMEIRSAAGGDPIGLATIQLNNGFGQSFNKQHVANQGYAWEKAFSGLLPILPAIITGQTSSVSFDLRFRGKLNVAADFEIRIADLNLPEMDTVALGAPAFMGYKFTTDATNRPVLAAAPTTTPASGATISVGGTIAINLPGAVAGGNTKAASRSWSVWRDGAQVGTMSPVKNGTAAVPYTTVSADAGKTLEVRQVIDNGITPTETFIIGTIAVNP